MTAFLTSIFMNYGQLTAATIGSSITCPGCSCRWSQPRSSMQLVEAPSPNAYAQIASTAYRFNSERSAPRVAHYKDRYCIIGAGPSGLIMARAFLKEGVPSIASSAHSDVGGTLGS